MTRIAGIIFFLMLLLPAAAAAQAPSAKLTAEESAQVRRGEIVVKNQLDRETAKGYGVAFGVLHLSSPEDFWSVLWDYAQYPDFFPRILAAREIRKTDRQSQVEYDTDAGILTLTHTNIHTIADDRLRLDYVLDKSRPHRYVRVHDGHWLLEQLEPGLWLLEYKMVLEFDFGVLSKTANRAVIARAETDLPDALRCVRRRVESGGAWKRGE